MNIQGKLDTTTIVKKVSRDNFMNGHRSTLSQVTRDVSKYTRKEKHKVRY